MPEVVMRLKLLAALIATLVGLSILPACTVGADEDPVDVDDAQGWTTTPYRRIGVSLAHPASWIRSPVGQRLPDDRVVGERFADGPFIVQRLEPRRAGSVEIWDMRELPEDAIVVWIAFWKEPVHGPWLDAEPPISLEDMEPIVSRFAGEASGRRVTLNRDEQPVTIEVWLGSAATAQDRDTVERVLASMRWIPVEEPLDS